MFIDRLIILNKEANKQKELFNKNLKLNNQLEKNSKDTLCFIMHLYLYIFIVYFKLYDLKNIIYL